MIKKKWVFIALGFLFLTTALWIGALVFTHTSFQDLLKNPVAATKQAFSSVWAPEMDRVEKDGDDGLEDPSSETKHTHDSKGSDPGPLYTCSMHPQVIQNEPGQCPICGMNLTAIATPPKVSPSSNENSGNENSKKSGKKIKYWVAPMDPTYISENPGKSPMGMDLVPVYEEGSTAVITPAGPAVLVDPVMVQNMGVRVAPVQKSFVIRNIRTIGEVEVAEDEVSVINLRFSGWVEKTWADQTGQKVEKGEKLFRIYSPEVVAAQEEYLLALNSQGAESVLTQSARKRLRLWEIPDFHIKRLVKTGDGKLRLIVRAPRSGFILQKNVVLGKQVKSGVDLYRVGKLERIWIKAEVYEYDAPWVKTGQKAKMYLSFQAGKTWHGQVGYIYPTLNSKSRTLTVRLEFDNPGLNLKPGMFATVYIEAQRHDGVLVIPTEAIIHSGERQIVFVTPKIGYYEPREVVTGLVGDNHVTEILSGLKSGDTVVVSGQFLLDSESQLQEAIQKLLRSRLQAKQKAQSD